MDVKKTLIGLSISLALTGGMHSASAVPEEGDSVESWGRWAVLSPAAGAEDIIAFAPTGDKDIGRCEASTNCPGVTPTQENPPEPPAAKGPCEAGMACGFARIDVRDQPSFPPPQSSTTGVRPAAEGTTGLGSEYGYFSLALDEEDQVAAYTITPRDESNLPNFDSGELDADIGDAFFRADQGQRPNRTTVAGPIGRDSSGTPVISEGSWYQYVPDEDPLDEVDNGAGYGGGYVWGVAATTAEMSSLMDQLLDERGDLVARFEGAAIRGGAVSMEIDFGSATWTGEFSGAVSFAAGGEVLGSSFVSNSAQFSDNVSTGIVEGGFVNAGNNAIGAYDVTDLNRLRDADVFNAVRQIETSIED